MKEKMVQDMKNKQPGPSYFMLLRISRHLLIKVSVCVCVCVCVCVFSSKLCSGSVNMNSVLSQRKKV